MISRLQTEPFSVRARLRPISTMQSSQSVAKILTPGIRIVERCQTACFSAFLTK